jgi:hypothetical protein
MDSLINQSLKGNTTKNRSRILAGRNGRRPARHTRVTTHNPEWIKIIQHKVGPERLPGVCDQKSMNPERVQSIYGNERQRGKFDSTSFRVDEIIWMLTQRSRCASTLG